MQIAPTICAFTTNSTFNRNFKQDDGGHTRGVNKCWAKLREWLVNYEIHTVEKDGNNCMQGGKLIQTGKEETKEHTRGSAEAHGRIRVFLCCLGS